MVASDHFAELTATLEDLHAIAVEGQDATATPDMLEPLLMAAKCDLRRARCILLNIAKALR